MRCSILAQLFNEEFIDSFRPSRITIAVNEFGVRSSESGYGVQNADFNRNLVNAKYATKVGTLNARSDV